MTTIKNTLMSALLISSASLVNAADSGTQSSIYDINGGSLGSGDGIGSGTWELTTSRNGDILIEISDNGVQTTTLTHTIVESDVVLLYTAASGTWSGTSTPTQCTNLGSVFFNGCNFISLNVPVALYDIAVNLDSDNLGTVSQKSDNTVLGVTATTEVTYTFE